MSDYSVLLLGGSGQLGVELQRVYADCKLHAPDHSMLPIEDSKRIAHALDNYAANLVINCAAFHQVQECEDDPDRAFAINASVVGRVSRECAARNIPFVTISTDYVFSGDDGRAYGEADLAAPKNAYGASKIAGEYMAQYANPNTFIIRVSGLFGRSGVSNKGPSFIERMLGLADAGEPIKVVENLVFSPSYAVHVADAMRLIIETGAAGVYHVTNSGQCSWYDLAVETLKQAGKQVVVEPTKYYQDPSKLQRPIYSPLRHDGLKKLGLAPMPPWQSAVADYVRLRNKRQATPR